MDRGASSLRTHPRGDCVRRPLLEDGALVLLMGNGTVDLVQPWLPRIPLRKSIPARHRAPACIDVALVDGVSGTPERPDPWLEMLALRGWTDDPDHISLLTIDRTLSGSVDLSAHRASIGIAGRGPEVVRDVSLALTVAAALLLGRLDRILLHAGAFVAPNGSAWLLVGKSHSGKSSTCANLIGSGWDYLADDQVVIAPGPGESLRVEGWPRTFHLDNGFAAGTITGERSPANPEHLGSGKWQRSAPLGGLLFPRIEPSRPSSLIPMSSTDALQEVIRQSPWLLADQGAAPGILARMLKMVTLPRYALLLGSDGYRDAARLVDLLQPALDGSKNGTAQLGRVDTRERAS